MATALSCVDSNSHRFSSVTGPAIRKLSLSAFRNYKRLKLELSREPIVLTGENGAGKTNLIEAVSFLAPGRGIRKARLSEIDMVLEKNQEQVSGVIERGLASWAVSVDLESKNDRSVIGTGRDEKAAVVGSDKRIVRINGHQVKSHSILSNYLSISWLTPQMDRLFLDGPSQRRRFLDRLVFAFDPKHSSRVNSYTHALRERNSLIRSGSTDDAWYLAFIAVDPSQHTKAIGSYLLREAFQVIDQRGERAYLEATSEQNKALYERHGFVEIGKVQFQDSPPVFPMIREAR